MSKSLISYAEAINWCCWAVILQCILLCGQAAYKIRIVAIEEYGPIIHEFDPYFNYRATEVSGKFSYTLNTKFGTKKMFLNADNKDSLRLIPSF